MKLSLSNYIGKNNYSFILYFLPQKQTKRGFTGSKPTAEGWLGPASVLEPGQQWPLCLSQVSSAETEGLFCHEGATSSSNRTNSTRTNSTPKSRDQVHPRSCWRERYWGLPGYWAGPGPGLLPLAPISGSSLPAHEGLIEEVGGYISGRRQVGSLSPARISLSLRHGSKEKDLHLFFFVVHHHLFYGQLHRV